MNEHKLLRMIEEAGFDFTPDIMNKLQKFQNLIWIEREECAKVCEKQANDLWQNNCDSEGHGADQCAKAIRKRVNHD